MKKELKTLLASTAVGLVLAAAIALTNLPAEAQSPSLPPPPYNVELGAVITNSARAPATVTTAALQNLAYVGVECTYNQTAVTGSPSTTFSIQFLDAASNQWQTLLTNAAVTTALNTPSTITISPGITAASNVALSLHLQKTWRVSQTTTSGTVTGTIGCNLLK